MLMGGPLDRGRHRRYTIRVDNKGAPHMTDNNTLLTGSVRDEYIKQRFEINDGVESPVDVNNLSQEFIKVREDFAAWYDAKTEEQMELIDEISDRTYYIIDEEEYDAFIEELNDYGITTAEQFSDAFRGEYEGTGDSVSTKFTEEYCDDCGLNGNVPELFQNAIDYELVWYQSFQYEFNTVEFKGNTYFFYNHF